MLRTLVVAAATAVMCASVSHAAERSATAETTTHSLVRSGSTIATPSTNDACDLTRAEARKLFALSKTSGTARWICRTDRVITVTYGPTPACPPQQTPQGRVVVCPAGTTGAYTQTKSWTAAPYPACAIEGDWTPTSPPAGICLPIDSDSDGVPDSADKCPTVHAAGGPNGCPATPPAGGTASLSWLPPTENTDGSALTNLAGYRISYGISPTALTRTVQVANPGVTSFTIKDLSSGIYYFAVRAYTSGGESASSNVISKFVQ